MAAFLQFSHYFCHCNLASSSISLYNILFGILLKAIVVSLLHAASLLADQPVYFRIFLCGPLLTRILSSKYLSPRWIPSIYSLRWGSRGCWRSLASRVILLSVNICVCACVRASCLRFYFIQKQKKKTTASTYSARNVGWALCGTQKILLVRIIYFVKRQWRWYSSMNRHLFNKT